MKLNLSRLNSISVTLETIRDIDAALESYKESLPGPAYMSVDIPGKSSVRIQLEREHFREVMNKRKEELIKHLEDRYIGFEYDPDADWDRD